MFVDASGGTPKWPILASSVFHTACPSNLTFWAPLS